MSATIEAFTAGLRRVPPWRPGRDAAAERHEPDGRGGPAASRVADAAAPHVVVVGGGIAGISAAVGLAERGVRVTLIEAESSLGGRVRSWPVDVPTRGADASGAPDDRATMSRGFHAFFRQYYNLRALLRRVDPSLECLRPVDDYPLRHADGTQDSFTQIATRPPLNFLSFVARSPSFGLRDLTRVDADRALDLLDVDFPATYSRYDGVSAADALDALRFPERMRSLALEVFARSFFAGPRDFSAGELVAMFHMYFLGSGEGLLFDVSRDDFDTTMWRPLRSYLEDLGAHVVTGCRVESIERDGEGFRVSAGAAAGAAGTDEASRGRLDFAIDRDDAHGSLRADAVVIATSRDVLQRLVDGTDLGDEAWRASVLTGEMAPRFIVQRLWFDRPVAAGRAPFVGTAAYGHLDNVSLVHYDIPWSLIRIEQRNGRIDRYGQKNEPRFHALILTSDTPGAKDDRTVAEKLLRREEEAHKLDGTAEAVSGLYRAEEEERRLIKELVRGGTVEEFLGSDPADDTALADLFGQVDTITEQELPARAELISLFDGDTADFVATALDEVYEERAEDLIGLASNTDARGGAYFSLSPAKAPDLLHRLKALPPSYLREQRVAERMLVTSDRALAQRKLTEARDSSSTMWPEVSFLTDIHPVVEWLTDKVLVEFGRQEAPVITTPHVDGPVFLVQGIHSNALGRPTVVRWMAVAGLGSHGTGTPEVRPMADALRDAKVGPRLARTGDPRDLTRLQELVPAAVAAARHHLDAGRAAWEEQISGPLAAYRDHVARWRADSLLPGLTGRRERAVEETADELARLLDQLHTTGRPLLRVLAVLDSPGAPDASDTGPAGPPEPADHPSDAQAEKN